MRKNYDLSHSLTTFVYDEWLERYKAMCALKNARVAILTTIKNKKGRFVTKVSAIRPFKNKKRDEVKPLKRKDMTKKKASGAAKKGAGKPKANQSPGTATATASTPKLKRKPHAKMTLKK